MTMTRGKATKTLMLARKVIANDWKQPIGTCEALDIAIDALKEQEISSELQEYAYECGYEHFFHECQNCEHRRIENKKVDRPHGEWIETTSGTICNNCGEYPYDDGEYHIANWHSDFCPSCGADMRQKK